MKNLTIFLGLLVASCQLEAQSIFGPIAKKSLQKILPELIKSQTPSTLTKTQIIRLVQSYPAYKQQVEASKNVVYHNGKFYKSVKDALNDSENNTMKDAIRSVYNQKQKRITSGVSLVLSSQDKDDIYRIQFALRTLGYDIKYDGLMGKETKQAVQNAFGIDCSTLSEKQICDQVIYRGKKSSMQSIAIYDLVIHKQNAEPEIKKVDIHGLNKELADYPCGIEEVCAKTRSEVGGSIQFSCKDKFGNEVVFTLSTEESKFELNLKGLDGNTAKLSINSEGKITATSSDGTYTRTINSNLRQSQ